MESNALKKFLTNPNSILHHLIYELDLITIIIANLQLYNSIDSTQFHH